MSNLIAIFLLHLIHLRFLIHRFILITASKYFAALLGSNFEEANHKEFILDDTDGETIKMIVDFCYTGNVSLTPENVSDLLTIASSVQLDMLEEKCREFRADNLNAANAVDTLMMADKYSFAELRQRTLNWICESFESMPSGEIQKVDHRLLQELMRCDQIDASEEMIFNRLYEWFERSASMREKHMPDLLRLIRLENIPSQVHFAALFTVSLPILTHESHFHIYSC